MILRTAFILFITLNILSAENCLAQEDISRFKEIFSKTEKFYKEQSSYALDVTYQFFDLKNTTTATETLKGSIEKKGHNYYSKIGPTEFIYLDDIFLKINHDEKAVLYSKAPNKKMTTPIDITALTDYFKNVKILNKDNTLISEVLFKEKSNLPYTKMVIVIDSSNYSIIKQELYLLSGVTYPSMAAGNKKTTEGKMVISFSPNTSKRTDVFNKSNYLKNSSTVSLSNKLSSYQLFNTTK